MSMKTTPSKYIDLADTIVERLDVPCGNIRLGIHEALAYLDRYPDQAPGQTITESELKEVASRLFQCWPDLGVFMSKLQDELSVLGTEVVPDPEPTNAEQIIDLMCKAPANLNRRDLAKYLDAAGVKAPGGDDADRPERDRAWWVENANVNDAEDCEACEGDLCPVHHGIALGVEFVTKKIAALGADPELFNSIPEAKTPEADDE